MASIPANKEDIYIYIYIYKMWLNILSRQKNSNWDNYCDNQLTINIDFDNAWP